jgi:hypothetical protein
VLLLTPDSVQAEILELQKVILVEEVKLNVVEKQVILSNLTIALEGQEDAIRIGRVFVHYDSYSKPCLEWKWTMFMYSSTSHISY